MFFNFKYSSKISIYSRAWLYFFVVDFDGFNDGVLPGVPLLSR